MALPTIHAGEELVSMDRIDFRSDTVTWPTDAMRDAMASARVGDDVYGEDPTVNALEERAASILGKEAGLFVASGTMGNLASILAHAGRGEEAIVGQYSHSISSEAGGMAALGGIVPRILPTDEFGRMRVEDIRAAVNEDDPHLAPTRLILLENSFGARNGYPLPESYFAQVAEVARENNLRVHVDGARFFNAVVALGLDPATLAQHVDSITFCLSKGLSAPVGSVICGSRSFIERARRMRKILGGAMRQAGILAAAGLVALDQMIERLEDDHSHAQRLVKGLQRIPGIVVSPPEVKTNIVFFGLDENVPFDRDYVARRLREEGNVWIDGYGTRNFRAVTHYWIGPQEVDLLLELLSTILSQEDIALAGRSR